jgi:hypothetical protein
VFRQLGDSGHSCGGRQSQEPPLSFPSSSTHPRPPQLANVVIWWLARLKNESQSLSQGQSHVFDVRSRCMPLRHTAPPPSTNSEFPDSVALLALSHLLLPVVYCEIDPSLRPAIATNNTCLRLVNTQKHRVHHRIGVGLKSGLQPISRHSPPKHRCNKTANTPITSLYHLFSEHGRPKWRTSFDCTVG